MTIDPAYQGWPDDDADDLDEAVPQVIVTDPGLPGTPSPMPTPFLTVTAFAAMWRPLSTAETAAATLFLQAATNWIVERKPAISSTDPAAQVVCLQVVSEAINAQKHVGLKQFSRTTGQRMEAGTLAEVAALLVFTPEQRDLLGISPLPSPSINVSRIRDRAIPDMTAPGLIIPPWW